MSNDYARSEAIRLITAHAAELARLAREPHWGRQEQNRLALVAEARGSLARASDLGRECGLSSEEVSDLQVAAGLHNWQ